MLYSVCSVIFSACFSAGVAGGIVFARVTVLAAKARENSKASPLHSSQLLCQTTPLAAQATDFHNWLLVKSITVSWYVIVSGRFTEGSRGAHPPFFYTKVVF